MSTLEYATLTSKRDMAAPGTSSNVSPGVSTYIDAFAALVPAEVLTLHALILGATTTTIDTTTSIKDPGTLSWSFLGLILLSMGLYVGARIYQKLWDRLDLIRMFIPPLAFVGWTMLQKATAFDAVFPTLPEAPRTVIALFGAVILGFMAIFLAYKADQKPVGQTNQVAPVIPPQNPPTTP